DTSVDPNEKPTARNEVIAELDANVDPPATVTDHDPTIVASEWTGEGKPEGKE
ncbi:ABC transporter permease, partial [Bifidobacterium longum]